MERVKEQQHQAEVLIHRSRVSEGVQAVRTWLYEQQTAVNRRWHKQTGEELYRLQGEARKLAQLIEIIDNGPAIKDEPRRSST